MGLSLVIKNPERSCRIGGYGYVHNLRALLCLCYLYRLDQPQNSSASSWIRVPEKHEIDFYDIQTADETREFIRDLIQENEEGDLDISYDCITDGGYREIQSYLLSEDEVPECAGLYKFVDHSDCDGLLSPGDAQDVLKLLEWIDPALHILKDEDQQMIRDLTEFFGQAVKHNRIVIFA